MRLAAPWGLAAATLAVPLIVWYLLRSRRPKVVVASTYLWGRADRSVSAAVPWQRFRGDVTFWLVLAAILLGSLALARPYLPVAADLGDHTILVMDASGSMLADEDGPTRLELARREADGLVERLASGQVMSVVEAGAQPRVLLSASSDPAAIRRALRAVEPSHGPADLDDAFTLAAALERPGQSTIVHLYTDGVVPHEFADAVPEGLLVTAVGTERANLAVTRLQTVPTGAGSSQVFVQVRNHGTLPSTGSLALRVDGEDVVSQQVELGPRASEDIVLQVDGAVGDTLVAQVSPTGAGPTGSANTDALGMDDTATTLLAGTRELTVVVATPGNVFLQGAFGALPDVDLRTTDTVPAPRELADVDLLVIDRLPAPETLTLPTLLVAPTTAPAGVDVTGEIERPAITYQAPDHELLAAVDLSQTALASGQRVEAPDLTTVAGGTTGPLILAGRLSGIPTVYVAFDLLESNLPLQSSWPVLASNAATWLAGPVAPQPATAGSTVAVPMPAGVTGAVVEPPSGAPLRVDPASPRITVDTVGLWRIRYEAADAPPPDASIAVNAAPGEGDLARSRPGPTEQAEAADAARRAGAAEGRRSVVPELLAVVLLIALAEWAWVTVIRPRRARRRGGALPAGVGA